MADGFCKFFNEKGDVLNLMTTPVDVDDKNPLKVNDFVKEIYGKLVSNKVRNFLSKRKLRPCGLHFSDYFLPLPLLFVSLQSETHDRY